MSASRNGVGTDRRAGMGALFADLRLFGSKDVYEAFTGFDGAKRLVERARSAVETLGEGRPTEKRYTDALANEEEARVGAVAAFEMLSDAMRRSSPRSRRLSGSASMSQTATSNRLMGPAGFRVQRGCAAAVANAMPPGRFTDRSGTRPPKPLAPRTAPTMMIRNPGGQFAAV
jgi:hypothetical protein